MFKSFLGLWLLVFGPLFFLLYPSSFSPIVRFNDYIEGQRFTEIYRGTFFLIESQLTPLPHSAWEDEIAKLRTKFGFELTLTDARQLGIPEYQKKQLHKGGIVFVNAEPEYLLKSIGHSNIILQLFTDFSAAEKISRGAQGTVYLLRQIFNNMPPSDWPAAVRRLSDYYPYHLRMLESGDMRLSEKEKQQLSAQSFFWRENSSEELSFYTPLRDDKTFLVADLIPMSSINPSVIFILILVFVLFISVCMFLWVYPLWRDLNNLAGATSEFGKGNLNSRAVVSRISVVARLGRVFNLMAERMEQLLKGQRTLTNAIAHDLRTPLYRLRFAFEMLGESPSEEQNLKYRLSISKSIEDLDHLINQTLLLSKYSSEKQFITFAKHNLPLLINEECENILLLYPEMKYELKFDLEPDQEMAYIDHIAMKRAVSNLLVNACKFACSYVLVELTYCEKSGEYIISVHDDGYGIEAKDLERVFLPFEQLTQAQRGSSSGHGLGLAIVRHIAHWHSGTIDAGRSNLGGAKFVFRWPAKH